MRRATYGTPAESNIPTRVRPADGLLGQAIKDKRGFSLDAVPDNYLYFGSSLGKAKPRQLLIAPAMADGEVNAVLELGYADSIDDKHAELLECRSEEHTSEIQSLMRISYAVFCLKKKKIQKK